MRRWLVYGVLGSCVLLLGMVWLMLATERGSLWLVAQLQSEQFNVVGLRGNFLDEMQIDALHLQNEIVQIDLQGVRLRVNFAPLLLSRLEVSYIDVADARVVRFDPVVSAPTKASADEFAGIPLRLIFPRVAIQRLQYQQGDQATLVTALQLAGSVYYKSLELTAFEATYADYTLHGDVQLSLQAPWIFSGHYRLLAPLGDVVGDVYGDQKAISGRGQVQGLTFVADLDLGGSGPALTVQVTAARAQAQDFVPDMAALEGVALASMRVRLETDFSRYNLKGTADLVSSWLPTSSVAIDSSYFEGKLTLANLSLATGSGHVDLAGIYRLDEQGFKGEVLIVDFPLAYLAAYIPSTITGRVSATGKVGLDQQRLTLLLPQIDGEVNQRRLSGSLSLAGSQLDDLVASVKANLAKNQLLAELDMATEELRIDFSGNELAAILPGTRGTLTLRGTARQWQKNLWVEANINAQDLAAFDAQVGRLTGSITSVPQRAIGKAVVNSQGTNVVSSVVTNVVTNMVNNATNAEYKVQLEIGALQWRDQSLGNLQVSLDGSLLTQRGRLDWQRGDERFSSQVEHRVLAPLTPAPRLPSLAQLTLTNSRLNLPLGQWQSPSLRLQYTDKPQVALLAPSCWESALRGQWCVDKADYAPENFQLAAHLSRLPVNLANLPGIPALALVGELSANINLTGDLTAWRGQLAYEMPNSLLTWSDSAEDRTTLDVSGQGKIETFAAVVDMQATSGQTHQLQAHLRVADLRQPESLEVTAKLASQDLGLLTAVLPFVADGQGQAQATVDYRQSGSASGPSGLQRNLTGQVSLGPGVSGLIPSLNMRFSELALEVAAPTDSDINFLGSASSGAGQMTLAGTGTQVFSPSRQFNATLKGSQFALVNRPELQMVASPDLAVMVQGQKVQLNGSLRLDSGRIEDKALKANSRGRSQDVVLATDEARKAENQTYEVDLELVVGDQVQIVLYGLNARVSGALRIRQSATRPLHVEGTLNISDGVFSRYGVEFQLERGRLVYNGSLTNPTVDVIARREIDASTGKVVVRLVMTGAATDIQSRLVASPTMSEADALSYLLLGRPLSGSSGSDGSMLANAALSFGLKKAVPITAEIQASLGLDQLSVAGKAVDTAAIVAGKRLSKNLYMEYNYGIFSRIGGLLLSYQLSEQLSLQAQSGTNDSLELIYKF
jgi:translocation and assembly module TamB